MEESHTLDGLLIIDKPSGMTSHDVVARIRRATHTKRVGHAGTLDPAATGVLVLGLGRATRLLTYLVGEDKDYNATIRLGQATNTDDAEGEITENKGTKGILGPAMVAAVTLMTGNIEQVPSAVSAIKIDGKRAYARVREGEEVQLAPRPVTISRLDIVEVRQATADDGTDLIDIDVAITCSSGTYIRALARDLGAKLGCGGHLTRLRRTRVGPFGIDQAVSLERAEDHPRLLPMARAVEGRFPVRTLTPAEAESIGFGRRIGWKAIKGGKAGTPVAAVGPDGKLVAMLTRTDSWAKPEIVFEPRTGPGADAAAGGTAPSEAGPSSVGQGSGPGNSRGTSGGDERESEPGDGQGPKDPS